jgi:hypothetical protein
MIFRIIEPTIHEMAPDCYVVTTEHILGPKGDWDFGMPSRVAWSAEDVKGITTSKQAAEAILRLLRL